MANTARPKLRMNSRGTSACTDAEGDAEGAMKLLLGIMSRLISIYWVYSMVSIGDLSRAQFLLIQALPDHICWLLALSFGPLELQQPKLIRERFGKNTVRFIGIFGVVLLRQLVENIECCYIFIASFVIIQIIWTNIFASPGFGFRDLAFLACLQILAIFSVPMCRLESFMSEEVKLEL